MILFPLMSNWMWLQILTASPLLSSELLLEETCDADTSQPPTSLEGGRI
jgi:hypothetical protein